MKTVGIIGGIGPESTIEYYRFLIAEYRARMLAIVERMEKSAGIEGVILAGTELPLILRDPERKGVPFLDTTLIHVNAAVDAILA